MNKAGIVGCSNGRPASFKRKEKQLDQRISQIGLSSIWSEHIYESADGLSATGPKRADSLMKFYKDSEISEIFDISGGDLANEVLTCLDFDTIAASSARFWGYSDLTTIINAIYTKTGKSSVLYQIRNVIQEHGELQTRQLKDFLAGDNQELFDIRYTFAQKESMSGIMIGGNIRCLLKLAGTEYWPDMHGKILLLEAYNGGIPQMTTYLNQLKQIGVFSKISGILLGTFTAMEREGSVPGIIDLVKSCVDPDLPIAYTPDIGHGSDSKAIIIGNHMNF